MEEFTRIDEDYETKMVGFESDCNDGKGEPLACHQVGEFLSIVQSRHDKAAKVYEMNCMDKKYNASCFQLGRLYLTGTGVEQNDEKAEFLFDRACKDGNAPSCFNQGMLTFFGSKNEKTGEINKELQEKSLKLMETACSKGLSDSCYFYGNMLIRTEEDNKKAQYPLLTEKRNPAKAMAYFEKACSNNHAPSCFNLAVMYKNGDSGVKKNDDKFDQYSKKTNELVRTYGGMSGKKTH